MPTYVFILLHLSYLLFLIFLINTYTKHVGDKNNNDILTINSDGIFIPKNPTFNEIYIDNLNNCYKKNKKNFKFKYINIIPYGDVLNSKNGLWSLLVKKYNKKELLKYFPKTFILEELYSRIDFHKLFYSYFNNNKTKKHNILLLKKNINNKKGIKLMFIKKKEDLLDIYGNYFNDNYKVIQEFLKNPYLYDNKIVILRVYLIIKKIPKKLYEFKRLEWIKCLYCCEDYNNKKENRNSFISNSKFYNEKYPKNFNELIEDKKDNKFILNRIDYIFNLIKKASKELIFENTILEESVQFQLYGCDFILDKNKNPYLLEMNKNPVLNNNFNKEEENIKKNIISNMYDYIRL